MGNEELGGPPLTDGPESVKATEPVVEPVAKVTEAFPSISTCELPGLTEKGSEREFRLTNTMVESSGRFAAGVKVRLTLPEAPHTDGDGRLIESLCCSILEKVCASKVSAGAGSDGVMPFPLSA